MRNLLRRVLGLVLPRILNAQRPWASQRRLLNGLLKANPGVGGVERQTLTVPGGPDALVYCPKGTTLEAAPAVLLYFHGGGYCLGAPGNYAALHSRLAKAMAAPVVAAGYRLAPEHPAPAALDDALAAYKCLLDQGKRVVLGGDSAGGGLSVALAHAAADADLPAPAGLALLSPWLDLTLSGGSVTAKAEVDPILNPAWGRACAAAYAGDRPLNDPMLSPLFGSDTLPPTLIQAGSDDILIDDARRLAKRVPAVELQEFPGLWHVFQVQVGLLPDAGPAVAALGQWVKARLGG